MLAIPLFYSNQLRREHLIEFRRDNLRMRQARFQNRYVLTPRIDLSGFRCKAVVDFVDIEIATSRPTHVPAMRRWISQKLNDFSLWCEQVDGTKNSGNIFTIRLQDPKIVDLLMLEKIIASTPAGLTRPIKIQTLEVSVDFFPRSAREGDRLTMCATLQRTYMPSLDIWKHDRDHPRFVWAKGRKGEMFFLPSARETGLHHQITPKSAFLDATVYYGDKDGPASVRIQNKISNQRTEIKAVALAQEEKRARIEVTLTGSALAKLKLNTIEDLARFKFTSLQGEHFHFALPTFQDQADLPHHQPVQELINARDRQCFAAGGVLCLERVREAKEVWLSETKEKGRFKRASHQQTLREHLARRGLTPTRRRAGHGEHGTSVAYAELNEMVRVALQELGRRINRREKRSR